MTDWADKPMPTGSARKPSACVQGYTIEQIERRARQISGEFLWKHKLKILAGAGEG
jgi:hypothetical protein